MLGTDSQSCSSPLSPLSRSGENGLDSRATCLGHCCLCGFERVNEPRRVPFSSWQWLLQHYLLYGAQLLFIAFVYLCAHVTVLLWRPEASLRAWVLHSTVWVSEIKFRLSGLAVPLSTEPSQWPQKVAQANLKHPPRTYPAGRTTTMDC